MLKPETYTCDHPGCEATKGETNHWYVVNRKHDHILVATWAYAEQGDLSCFSHFCGADHAMQAVSRWLSERAQS